jgi:hypothetical protein
MNFFKNFLVLGLLALSALVLNSRAYAYGDYGLSCTNDAYGIHLYTDSVTVSGADYGIYSGLDCAYSGGGRTNSSAIVAGEVARLAANAVIGAVTGRLSSAMSNDSNTAAHMSYSSDGNGIGMAANHIVGGLSLWTNFANSNFENDQTFTSVQLDSNNFDGDSSAVTVGVDKRLGNFLVGLAYTAFDADIDTSVNKGNMSTEGETIGLYLGLNTGALSISAGAGQGEYEVDTTRQDLGSGLIISASDITADVTYFHFGASGNLNRGKLSFSPRVSYRSFDLDMPAFTDVVPDDGNSITGVGSGGAAVTGTYTTLDDSISGKTYSTNMTEAGLNIAIALNSKLTPFVDIAYVNEDTTSASYKNEALTDGSAADLAASAPDGYVTYGGGLMLNLQSKLSGYLSVQEVTNRDDYSETTVSGSLRFQF